MAFGFLRVDQTHRREVGGIGMTIALILAWTMNGASVAYPATRFATDDLCQNAASILADDIINHGGIVHIARCVPVALRKM